MSGEAWPVVRLSDSSSNVTLFSLVIDCCDIDTGSVHSKAGNLERNKYRVGEGGKSPTKSSSSLRSRSQIATII